MPKIKAQTLKPDFSGWTASDSNINSPSNILWTFLKKLKNSAKTNLQQEFNANATRVNTPADEMDLEKSTSLLPTLARALNKGLPKMMGNFFSIIGQLINGLLGFFGVKKATQQKVSETINTVGASLLSDNPGEGLQNVVKSVAPLLMQALTSFLGVKVSPKAMQLATAFPNPNANTFTPRASARRASVSNPVEMTAAPKRRNSLT